MRKILFFLSLSVYFHSAVLSQTAPPFWKDIVEFRKQDSARLTPAHPILFIGSSSFTKWTDISDYFPGYPIVNRGFGGSVLTDLTRYFYDIVLPYQPKQVFIYCGENDLASSDSITVSEVVKRFKTLYSMIRQNLPEAVVDFVSIKPSPVRSQIQDKVQAANKEISLFLKKEKKAAFIDIYPAMLDNAGSMREELYLSDRLHMKPEGYKIWQKIMSPYLLK